MGSRGALVAVRAWNGQWRVGGVDPGKVARVGMGWPVQLSAGKTEETPWKPKRAHTVLTAMPYLQNLCSRNLLLGLGT
jgi:hypothetical protein